MNRFILFFLPFLFISFSTFSQDSDPFGYINTTLSFTKTTDAETIRGFYGPMIREVKISDFRVKPSINKFISNSLTIGVGLGYGKNKYTTYLSGDPRIINNDSERTESIVSPFIMIEKFFPLSDKLSFTGMGNIFGHFANVQSEYYMYDVNLGTSSSFSTEVKTSSFEISLNPSLRYDLFSQIGIQLIFGRLSYEQSINDSSINDDYEVNESEVHLDFSPQNWQLGFFYRLL
ncbi:MAG: hypothetical protein ACNS60_17860 [Candidatus Cyclobacteriaceae bacterium M2_1C_046]